VIGKTESLLKNWTSSIFDDSFCALACNVQTNSNKKVQADFTITVFVGDAVCGSGRYPGRGTSCFVGGVGTDQKSQQVMDAITHFNLLPNVIVYTKLKYLMKIIK